MLPENKKAPVILVVMDGWGMAQPGPGNAIAAAQKPNFDRFWSSYPHTQLSASGQAVGLPREEVGSTETGHLNLGAGRIVYQELVRINMSVADGSFMENQALGQACDHVKNNNSKIHLMGLLGAGGVHSSMEHLFALIHLCKSKGIEKVYLHLFTDGRDSPPSAALTYIHRTLEAIEKEGVGQIASLMGRYWAMDRDQRWERTEKAYLTLTQGRGNKSASVEEVIKKSYEKGITDEFIEPTNIVKGDGSPVALIEKDDAAIFFNFRIDRPRQLARALVLENLEDARRDWGFDPYAIKYEMKHDPKKPASPVFRRGPKIENLFFVTMTEYSHDLVESGAQVAFPPEKIISPLGKVLAQNNLKQLRAAESEKERFVTYYFNGLSEDPEPGEDRLIVPSPDVPTYDLQPEMSARPLTVEIINRLMTGPDYSFVIVNFANADMVGHTGNFSAAVSAVETVDHCIGELSKFILDHGGVMLITADHGNAESMVDPNTGKATTEHTSSPVPFIVVSKGLAGKPHTLPSGILADVAPTILSLMNIPIPNSMTGRNILAPLMQAK